MLPTKFQFGQVVSGEELKKNDQSETRIACGSCLLTDRDEICIFIKDLL